MKGWLVVGTALVVLGVWSTVYVLSWLGLIVLVAAFAILALGGDHDVP